MSTATAAIHWFRKGLRLHDNPALVAACRASTVYPVFILDPHFADPELVGVNRYRFLLQTLRDLDDSLRSLGSRLYLVRGKPEDRLRYLIQKWNVKLLTFEADYEPYAKDRDSAIIKLADQLSVETSIHESHNLREMSQYASINNRQVTYGVFCSLFNSLPAPLQPCAIPGELRAKTSLAATALLEEEGILYSRVPTLAELGYPEPDAPSNFPGGETEGLRRLAAQVIARPQWVNAFEKPLTSPNALDPSTTVLSPYLKFGCVSVRTVYMELLKIQAATKGPFSKPPVSLEGQLLWREYFYVHSYHTPNFDKMIGNPRCRQIPWNRNDVIIEAWKNAQTGYPFIDAIMTQLRTEGWIHHLARHAVACFLTRGDLWQHWEEGAKVFDLYLLDADWALNSGNWQWLSCSNFFYQYFRCYSPVAFGKKTDKNGDYIRKWLPQLRDLPQKYIYEPWTAPVSVQKSCNCVIGKDYPNRIVIHEIVSKQNMEKMKLAYSGCEGEEEDTSSSSKLNTLDKAKAGKAGLKSFFKSSTAPAASKSGDLGVSAHNTIQSRKRKLGDDSNSP